MYATRWEADLPTAYLIRCPSYLEPGIEMYMAKRAGSGREPSWRFSIAAEEATRASAAVVMAVRVNLILAGE